jgi:hypothetical protein
MLFDGRSKLAVSPTPHSGVPPASHHVLVPPAADPGRKKKNVKKCWKFCVQQLPTFF